MALDAGASSSNNSRQALEFSWDIQILKTIFDPASNIRNLSIFKIQQIIQQIEKEINQAVEAMQSETGTDHASLFSGLKNRINDLALHSRVAIFNTGTEAYFGTYLTLLGYLCYTDKHPQPEIINQIVANYLFLRNDFEVGDAFIREAGVSEASTFRSQYKELHEILRSLQEHDIDPATYWISRNRSQPEQTASRIQFELYRQKYLEMLKTRTNPMEVLNFMRTYMTQFDKFYWEEIKSLAGCILWTGRMMESPYANLLSSSTWDKVANDFTKEFISLLGQSSNCPLTSVCNVGAQKHPQLFSLRDTVRDQEQLDSIESEFDSEYVCQNCREIATVENPPILLPCGHALLWHSVSQLSNGGKSLFRCPFCSHLIYFYHCQRLYI